MSSDFINHLLSYTCGLTVKVLESLTQTPSSHRTKGFFWICHNRTVFDSIKNWQIMSVRLCKNLIKWYVISSFLYTYFIQREKAHKHSKHKLSLPVCVSVCLCVWGWHKHLIVPWCSLHRLLAPNWLLLKTTE